MKMVEKAFLNNCNSSDGIRVWSSERLKRGVRLSWILATALGAAAGSAAFQALRQRSFSLAWLVGVGIFGLVIGLAQSSVLARVFCKSGKLVQISLFWQWTLTSLIGWVAGGMAGFVIPVATWLFLAFTVNVDYTWMRRSGSYVHWASFILLGALTVSLVQRRILYKFNPAKKWIWTSFIGWTVAWAMGLGVAHITTGSELTKAAVGGAIGGVIVGMITSHALIQLLAGSPRENSSM